MIRQLGSEKWKVREAASRKLAALGPKILPILRKYRKHADLEIATRVQALINSYGWITKGAVVIRIQPGTQAERVGVRVGDVFVRVDDLDISNYTDLRKVDYEKNRIYLTRRDGKFLSLRAGPGLIGCYCINWDQAKGGPDHAQGVAALAAGRYGEAYKRLLAAYNAGMNDSWTIMKLWGLAEYALEHKQAMAIHSRFLGRYPSFLCTWSHGDIDRGSYGLPMSNVHAAHLLGRMEHERYSPDLYHRLDSYFTHLGRNLPLARQTTGRNWPDIKQANLHYRTWHVNCRMRIALHDRRWQDVLADYRSHPGDLLTKTIALRAAVNTGRTQEACRIGLEALAEYKKGATKIRALGMRALAAQKEEELAKLHSLSFLLYAVAAAVADGRDDPAGKLLDGMLALRPDEMKGLLGSNACLAWRHMAVAPRLAPLLRERLTRAQCKPLNLTYLRLLAYAPDLTADRWNTARKAFGRGADDAGELAWLSARVLLRLGRVEQARQAARQAGKRPNAAFRKALAFLDAHRDRLEKDWAPLKGVFQVYDARPKAGRWAVRYDGTTFYIDPKGKIHPYPGLAPGQVHDPDQGDEIRGFAWGCVSVRRARTYLLDDKAGRWLPTFAAPQVEADHRWLNGSTPAMLRFLLKQKAKGDRAVLRHVEGPGDWSCHQFSDHLTLAANAATRQVLDLPAGIARRAGRKGRAAVYRVRPLNDRRMLIPTDVGLWMLDADGTLARVKLPLKDPNVMVSVMTWPSRAGRKYVGVAPQQGGQVFEIDARTHHVRLTGGYCGKGPDDAFAAAGALTGSVACESAIQRIYESRLARVRRSQPARRPGRR